MTYEIEGLTGAEHAHFFGPEWYEEEEKPMLYIFDKDGTIVTKQGGEDPPIPNNVDEQVPLPGVVEKCRQLRKAGHTLAIASNQGGVAWGFISLDEATALMKHAADLIGATWWKFCPHHPEAKGSLGRECDCRKPKPGMLRSIMRHLGFWPISTVMVGDMESDRDAAAAAGVGFEWAADFFAPAGSNPAARRGLWSALSLK